jgi:hypothetical protein
MKSIAGCFKILRILFNTALLALILGLSIIPKANADSLYIGDDISMDPSVSTIDKVIRFNAGNGQFQSEFIKSNSNDASGGLNGGFEGPRALISDHSGNLYLVNQNVGLNFSGSVLQFDGKTGAFLKAIIPPTDTSAKNRNPDPNAPFAPRGMVLWDNRGFQAQTLEIFETIEFQVFSQRDGYQQGFKGPCAIGAHRSVGTSLPHSGNISWQHSRKDLFSGM